MPVNPMCQFLSSNGDGTGTTNMGTTADEYYIQADANKTLVIERIIVFMQDSTINDATLFGGLTALTNGCQLRIMNGSTVQSDLTPITIKSNGDFARYAHDLILHSGFGAGEDVLTSRWTFTKFSPKGVVLTGTEKLSFNVQDALTGITEMTIVAEGYEVQEGEI